MVLLISFQSIVFRVKNHLDATLSCRYAMHYLHGRRLGERTLKVQDCIVFCSLLPLHGCLLLNAF